MPHPGAPGAGMVNTGTAPGQPNPADAAAFDMGLADNFHLDFSSLETSEMLDGFDFDSYINTTDDNTFPFDGTVPYNDENGDHTGDSL
ncbi:hypothetical protein KEM56_001567 [Ascosphaera pollenicola]|nr:hypothetical protein KEM56_001567 [Ascosphaera pollenicola]